MQEIFRTIRKIAEYKTTVLITGESGTGKELVARAIHEQSPRAAGRSSRSTAARSPRRCSRASCSGTRRARSPTPSATRRGSSKRPTAARCSSTRSASCRSALQVKLLRVLQEQMMRPIGARRRLKVDVRVVAATLRDLPAEVQRGPLPRGPLLPPERAHDRAAAAARAARGHRRCWSSTSSRAPTRKLGHADRRRERRGDEAPARLRWPGNVRELENTIERAMVLCDGQRIEAEGLPERIRESRDRISAARCSGELSIKKTTRIIEEELIRRALRETRATAPTPRRYWRSAIGRCSTRSRSTGSMICRNEKI